MRRKMTAERSEILRGVVAGNGNRLHIERGHKKNEREERGGARRKKKTLKKTNRLLKIYELTFSLIHPLRTEKGGKQLHNIPCENVDVIYETGKFIVGHNLCKDNVFLHFITVETNKTKSNL